MPSPKSVSSSSSRPLPRRSLRGCDGSPPESTGRSPHSKGPSARSPARHKLEDEVGSDSSDSGELPADEVDRSTQHSSSSLYPDLLPLLQEDGSPERGPHSFRDNSDCRLRSGEKPKTKTPLVPHGKGSAGRRLYPDLPDYDTRNYMGASPVVMILFCFLVLLGGFFLLHSLAKDREIQASKPHVRTITEIYADLKNDLRQLNREFTQPREVWVQLLGQLEAVMVEEPRQPSVVLVVAPQDSRGAAVCLTHKLARAVKYAFKDSKFVMHDMQLIERQSTNQVKVELDEALQGLAWAHAAVVHNIERIPGPAAMIFHAYCDNENAPFKQAIIFLVVEVMGNYEEIERSRLDTLIDTHLAQLWGDGLDEEDVSAIISRVANAPILVRPEKFSKIQELCPL